jgi:hypothetical protein
MQLLHLKNIIWKLPPKLMQLVTQEDFVSHVVAASKEYNLEIATKRRRYLVSLGQIT